MDILENALLNAQSKVLALEEEVKRRFFLSSSQKKNCNELMYIYIYMKCYSHSVEHE